MHLRSYSIGGTTKFLTWTRTCWHSLRLYAIVKKIEPMMQWNKMNEAMLLFYGPLSRTARVRRYQKKQSPTHSLPLTTCTHTHIHFMALWTLSGITRVSCYQNQSGCHWSKTGSGSGISRAICKSAPRSRQIIMPTPTTQLFTGRMPFLPPNQQHQSTEDNNISLLISNGAKCLNLFHPIQILASTDASASQSTLIHSVNLH